MQVEDVVDRESLEVYLKGLPDDVRLTTIQFVAFRSAARVAPIAMQFFAVSRPVGKGDLTALPVWAGVTIPGVACKSPTPGIGRAAANAAYAAAATATAAANAATAAAAAATAAAATAANAATAAAATAANAAYAAAATAANAAYAAAAAADADYWAHVRRDLLGFAAGQDTPLWDVDSMPSGIADAWQAACVAFRTDPFGTDWTFWITWYERVLAGKDIYPNMLAPILNEISKDDWLGDPDAVNGRFKDVLAAYQADDIREVITATPIAADVVYEDETLQLRPTDQIADTQLSVVLNQIEDATRIFDGGSFGTNSFPLNREIDILNSALSRYRSRPVELLKTVTRVCKRLDVKIENGECPSIEKDADIADFREVLVDVQLDLIAFNPDVKAYHDAKKRDVDEQAAPKIAEAAREVSASADSAFATALTEAAFTLLDPTVDDFARQAAQYWIIGSVTRSYKAAKTVVDEAADVTKKAATISAGVAWLLSPQFRMFIDDVIKLVAP